MRKLSQAYQLQNKCKVMLHDFQNLRAPWKIQGEALEMVDRLPYPAVCISSDCSLANEFGIRISKARVAFANLHRLWRWKEIGLSFKGRVYGNTARALLSYGSETWFL